MALGASLNLGYLIWIGHNTDFAAYNPASLVGLIVMMGIARIRIRSYESDWLGLWRDSFPLKAAPFVRIGLRSVLVLAILGILVPYGMEYLADISTATARPWMSQMLYVLNFVASLNFLLFCLFGDSMIVSRNVKMRWMRWYGGQETDQPSEVQKKLADFEKSGKTNTEFVEAMKRFRKEQ